MWALRALLIALVFVAAVAFAYSNVGIVVDVNLQPVYSDMADVPLISVVGWALGIGLFLSLLMFISTYIKLSVQIRAARKRIKSLETEVAILRNRPIEESADLLKGADGESGDQRSAFSES